MTGSREQQSQLALRVLERWRERGVARRVQALRAGAPARVIWERPAAAGEPPEADLRARAVADVLARYATMRGWQADRRGARDCHAPAIELAVARSLGLESRAAIEEHGIADLAARCRAKALASAGALDALSARLGLQAAATCRTLDADYVESVWWAVKEIADAGRLHEHVRVAPYCPRCETVLCEDEVVHADAVRRRADVRFRVARDGGPLQAGDELLVSTTDPWTLVANAAVAVDPELMYVRVKTGTLDAPVVLAEQLAEQALAGVEVRVLERFRGAAIDGVRYEPPFGYLPAAMFGERGHTVLLAAFVTATEGTGIASVAPAYAADDLRLATRYGLAVVNPVDRRGAFDARAGRYAGREVYAAEPLLLDDLRARGRVLHAGDVERAAPRCGSCATSLLSYAKASWYVASSRIRGDAGRLLSVERVWGTPLPVWRCEHGHVTVVGSFEELEQRSGSRLEDPHRPYADDIAIPCECGGQATRVPDLVAPWFEAGAMPFATAHEPFAGELTIDELYPADVVCAPPGQARRWPSALRGVSALLRGGDQVFGHVVRAHPSDAGGAPSSNGAAPAGGARSADGEAPDAGDTSADALRWRVLTGAPRGTELVARLLSASELSAAHPPHALPADLPDLDRWIRSRASAAIETTGERLDDYDVVAAASALAAFAGDLCGRYAPAAHERLRAGDDAACATLRACTMTLAQLVAPFMPFVAYEAYDALGGAEPSVHLSDWPVAGPRHLELEAEIGLARDA